MVSNFRQLLLIQSRVRSNRNKKHDFSTSRTYYVFLKGCYHSPFRTYINVESKFQKPKALISYLICYCLDLTH